MRAFRFRQFIDGRFKYSGMCDPRFDNSFTAPHCYFDCYYLEQFTGLVDKNGVEIYEGDLFDYKGQIVIVEYVDDMFHLKSTKYKNLSPGNYRLNTIGPRLEILGNIHQHSELLKDKS